MVNNDYNNNIYQSRRTRLKCINMFLAILIPMISMVVLASQCILCIIKLDVWTYRGK